MARISDATFNQWVDGETVTASEYKRERDIIRVAINDNYDRLLLKYDKTEIDSLLAALEADVETQISANAQALTDHKSSSDHDYRYYLKGETDAKVDALKGTGYTNQTLYGLKTLIDSVQAQVDTLDNVYSTDAERIAAINDVINQFQIADGSLETMINNKANKSDTYTKGNVDSLLNNKADKVDTYTKAEVNSQMSLKANQSTTYTKLEVNGFLDTKASANDTYRKSEVDDSLALKADKSDTFTKAEVNMSLSGKADKSTTYTRDELYTKSETDSSLASKANKGDSYLKSETYSKGETDTFFAGTVADQEIVQARLGKDGTAHTVLKNRLDKMEGEQLQSARTKQILQHGVNVLSTPVNGPVDFEIAGRSLVSMANSQLQNGKHYVLADKKTKVWADGAFVTGVGKFKKSDNLVTKANFVDKVSGSTTANPHVFKYATGTSLALPTSGAEMPQPVLDKGKVLDGAVATTAQSSLNSYSQEIFSFNIIEQIERKMGRIPATDKVQWVKDNVNKFYAKWHGYGIGPAGNKATFSSWRNSTSSWVTAGTYGGGAVGKVEFLTTDTVLIPLLVGTDGFVHFLAYSEPSDGVIASTIHTDFIELEIELKTTAVLDTKPAIIRTANYEGKVSGSTVENPHVTKHSYLGTLKVPTDSGWIDATQDNINRVMSLSGSPYYTPGTTTNTHMSQHLFSFDLIAEIERNIGKIPKSTTADKVQWLKDNVAKLTANWHGYGSSVGGNKASVSWWNSVSSLWASAVTTSASSVVKVVRDTAVSSVVGPDGFAHFLAYAEPSDGTTASTINTDFISLDIELKPAADFHHPLVPLYEITQDEYDKVLVTWAESEVLNRYPRVQGVQHLQNPAVIAEGENLLPPFYEWTLHANATIKSPYELELNATAGSQVSEYELNTIGNQTYTLELNAGATGRRIYVYYDGVFKYSLPDTIAKLTFTTETITKKVKLSFFSTVTGKFTFTNPMLTLGSTAKPFVPANKSYLFASVKLGAIADKKDTLYKQDGAYYVRKLIEKDVVLDGSLAWSTSALDYIGYKRVNVAVPSTYVTSSQATFTKHNGRILNFDAVYGKEDVYNTHSSGLYLTIADADTGWGETFAPTADDIKRYFNGWKYSDGITWTSVTGNGQTADAATALASKPTDYTPYKLSYVLASPKAENISTKVEGDIAVNGPTQVEVTSGVIVREKANPKYYAAGKTYGINNTSGAYTGSLLAQKTEKIVAIYKNTIRDTNWTLVTINAYGKQGALVNESDFDTTANYYVTYLVLDRHLFTVNGTEVNAVYAQNIRSALDDVVSRQSDIASKVSVNDFYIYKLLLAAKANGWEV